jgi:hypothetical protein
MALLDRRAGKAFATGNGGEVTKMLIWLGDIEDS